MKLRSRLGIVFGVTLGIALCIIFSPSVQAATKYTVVSEKWYNVPATSYRAKCPNKKVALWNKKHTKRYGYLTDRPNTTFTLNSIAVLKHGNTKAVYYYVDAGGTKKHPKGTLGYVWRGYLTKGLAMDQLKSRYVRLAEFSNNADYANYIKYSKSQKITKALVKALPNMKLNLDLTNIAAYKFAETMSDEDPSLPDVKSSSLKTKNYTHITYFPKVTAYLKKSNNVATATRVKKVKRILAKDYGLTTAKLNHLKNYQIGLYIAENTTGNKVKDNAPLTIKFYAFAIAQRVNH
ncbi:hypothetical protein FC99_GL001006 [Levilactobacillus koreensis JCM 16448]|uniref:D-alanyl-D-alanine carboxypeptidase n=1 Tax=Levilactobacillus koreensis TaxID=637971 RepID=A0AAC8UXV1_9LACO|nr:hypothetical protein [Levilactobacillus koreensis]AKP65844.1 hypothetical protein ABN16_13040 [Levilactobacillus koreensis]KRK87182.1 hypothetical protein FC99_GL001006 [Levilactobacillus koreensis JCM 16448]